MKVLFYSKECSTNFYFKDELTNLGCTCDVAESISDCIRSIQLEAPNLFLWDSGLINLFDFDVFNHIQIYGYDFDCYDINNQSDIEIFAKKYPSLYEVTIAYQLLQKINNLPANFSSEQVKFIKKHNLQKHHVHLLKHFISHPNEHISSEVLAALLWKNDSSNHAATLYSYIHQIKQMAFKISTSWGIKKTSKGCYQFHNTQ